jgi:RNA polymerase subunit RPABC4/transcription elongation factor Spt4
MICEECKTIIPKEHDGHCPDCLKKIKEEL